MVGKTTNSGLMHANLLRADEARGKSIERLASGKRVSKGSDDPAALAMVMAFESQTRGLIQQIGNRQDEISMLQTAEGALSSLTDVVQRINELSVQAANGTLTDSDRSNIQSEIDQLTAQIDQTAGSTTYNGKNLLDGSMKVNLQSGDTFTQPAANSTALRINNLSLNSVAAAGQAVTMASQALSELSSQRGSIGAAVNGISGQVSGLQNELVNVTAAQSRIEDVDMAAELINLSIAELQSKFAIQAFKVNDEMRQTVLNLIND